MPARRQAVQALDGPVGRHLPPDLGERAEYEAVGELLPERRRQVSHRLEVVGALLVDPLEELPPAERGLPHLGDERFEGVAVERAEVVGDGRGHGVNVRGRAAAGAEGWEDWGLRPRGLDVCRRRRFVRAPRSFRVLRGVPEPSLSSPSVLPPDRRPGQAPGAPRRALCKRARRPGIRPPSPRRRGV